MLSQLGWQRKRAKISSHLKMSGEDLPSGSMFTMANVLLGADVDADVNGMLGGFPYISRIDLQGSRNFLAKLGIGTKQGLQTVGAALEGGAG